jgi:hypothetical protein
VIQTMRRAIRPARNGKEAIMQVTITINGKSATVARNARKRTPNARQTHAKRSPTLSDVG